MSKYIKTYATEASFASALQAGLQLPNISLVTGTGKTYCIPEDSWGLTIPVDGSTAYTVQGSTSAWNAYKAGIGRYLLTYNGLAKKLSATDSTKLADGTTFSVDDGNVMVRIPRLSYMVVRDSSGRDTVWMSARPVFNNVIEEQWIGAYLASYDGTRLRSKKGMTVAASRTINTFWQQAQANGTAWGIANYQQRILMVLLYLSEYRSLDSQGALGYGMNGNTDNWSEAYTKPTGATSSLGDSCGTVDGGTSNANAKHISLFGLEDIYGWYWEMTGGMYVINNTCYVYDGNRMPDSTELASHPKGDYRSFARVASNGYITKLVGGEYFDVMPAAVGGGTSSYWCDYTWQSTGGQLLLWGGSAVLGSNCGLVYSTSDNAWTIAGSTCGARLAYYGKVNIY